MTEDSRLSVAQWIRVSLIAGLFGVAGAILNAVLLRSVRGHPTSIIPVAPGQAFAQALLLAALFALAYDNAPALRRWMTTLPRMVSVAAAVGLVELMVIRIVRQWSGSSLAPFDAVALLRDVVCVNLPIVWITGPLARASRTTREDEGERPAATLLEAKAAADIGLGTFCLVFSFLLIILSTSKEGGPLVFLGVVIIPVCGVVMGVGTRRFLRGVFAAQGREASGWATITLPMAVGAWAILYGLVLRPPVSF